MTTDRALYPYRWRISSFLLVRGLGLVFLIAFVSLWVQVIPLVGANGILPVDTWLTAAHVQLGPTAWHQLPTFLWFDASDATLHALCGLGTLASLLLLCGVAPAVNLLICWALYLSLAVGCRDFLNFQWDALLLEAGLLAILVAPLSLKTSASRWPEASRWGIYATQWLLVRLMFLSGAVKLLSGDPNWHSLKAMAFHYHTQPLPNRVAWWMDQLPLGWHRIETLGSLVVELALPVLALLPFRWARLTAATGFVGLMLFIQLVGNHGFFNILAILLCVVLLEDADWPRRLRERFDARPGDTEAIGLPRAVAIAGFVISVFFTLHASSRRLEAPPWPAPLEKAADVVEPLRSFNAYGLYAVMTTTRREISIEGSADGRTWKAYEMPYQAGDPQRAPPQVAPHMPRTDWLFWFAALGKWDSRRQAWLHATCVRLLEGSPEVRRLFAVDPFPDAPPRFIRTTWAEYTFTTRDQRRETGAWWTVGARTPYGPTLTLENGGPVIAEPAGGAR